MPALRREMQDDGSRFEASQGCVARPSLRNRGFQIQRKTHKMLKSGKEAESTSANLLTHPYKKELVSKTQVMPTF